LGRNKTQLAGIKRLAERRKKKNTRQAGKVKKITRQFQISLAFGKWLFPPLHAGSGFPEDFTTLEYFLALFKTCLHMQCFE
jgi:hypothetical protein